MPVRGVGVTDQTAGAGVAEVRARERTVDGGTYAEQYIIPISERVASFKGMAGSFRTVGNAASPQNLLTIENAAGSSVLVALRRITVQMDATAVLVAVSCQYKTARTTAVPSAGTALTKVSFDSAQSSASQVTVRGATASDGGAATAITATAGSTGWHQFAPRMHTLVGQVLMEDQSLLPTLVAEDPIILRAGEAIVVQVINATAANNASTNNYLVNVMWEEFTLP